MDAHAADPQSLGDGRRTMPRLAHLSDLGDGHRGFTAFVDALRLGCFDPACCRSRMNRRSISATMPSTVTRIGPAASLVEKAGSTASCVKSEPDVGHGSGWFVRRIKRTPL